MIYRNYSRLPVGPAAESTVSVHSRGMNIFDLDFIAHHIIFSLPLVLCSFAKCKFGRRIAHIIRAYIYRKYGAVYNMIYRVCILYTFTTVRILLLCVLRRRTHILQNDRTFGRSIRSRRWNIVVVAAAKTPLFAVAKRSSSPRMTYADRYFSSWAFIIHTQAHNIIIYKLTHTHTTLRFCRERVYVAKWFGHHIIRPHA